MNVDFAFVCDYAEVSGKINALGIGFDTIYANQVPARHPHFSVVMQLRASAVEAGQKKVEVNLIDEDGRPIIPPLQAPFNLPKVEGGTYSIGRFVVEFAGVEFKSYGSYSVRVTIEGIEMASLPFRISPPPKTQ